MSSGETGDDTRSHAAAAAAARPPSAPRSQQGRRDHTPVTRGAGAADGVATKLYRRDARPQWRQGGMELRARRQKSMVVARHTPGQIPVSELEPLLSDQKKKKQRQ